MYPRKTTYQVRKKTQLKQTLLHCPQARVTITTNQRKI